MACQNICPIFTSSFANGIKQTRPLPDGYSVYCNWESAIPSLSTNLIGYNLYYSTNSKDVFTEGPKHFTTYESLIITGFVPGDVIYFGLKATEYDPIDENLKLLPISPHAENAYNYTETLLKQNIDNEQLNISLVDISEFPSYGILKIGSELVKYSNVDYLNNVIYGMYRGYYNSTINYHNVDGYDGYRYQDSIVRYFGGFEDGNNVISQAEPRCELPNFPYTNNDGYKQTIKDILTTDLTASDEFNEGFPSYDYSGYHKTNIIDYFSGHCIGSYAGGEYGCADGYKLRGMNLQEESNKRLEMMLDVESEPVILLRRLWTGIRCSCYRMNQERPEGRCPICLGTSYVGGYEQYYNPRTADGKLMIRFDPTVDDLAIKPQGLQQNFVPNCWTLVVPTIKDRDVLIRFNQDMQEEFRYEVVNVTRNKLLFSLSGAQKMQVFRLDKTDIAYQWRANKELGNAPKKYNTTISNMAKYGPHLHTVIAPNGYQLNNFNSTTSIVASHSHPIINGVVQNVLGHNHDIIFV